MLDIINCDCMELMKHFPDKHFGLAIVDPPYGLHFSHYERGGSGIKTKERYTKNGKKKWDMGTPNNEYFLELQRVSKNQIIWGSNYFNLPPTQCFIFWYKRNPVPNFSDGELAYTSFKRPALCFDYCYYGNISTEKIRIHPTQKPVVLYEWQLNKFAKKGDKILDTHMGSGSIAIACHNLGFDLTACELDKDYYDAAMKRIAFHQAQKRLFT